MSVATQGSAVRTGRVGRALIVTVLIFFALFYLLPLGVMLINSLKPLPEITGGNMMALPREVAELAGLLPLLALFWYWRPPPAFEKEQRQEA